MTLRRTLATALAAVVSLGVLTGSPDARTDPSNFSIGELAAIDLVNSYLNDIRTLQGDFRQVAPDGQVTQGKFFIDRPGKVRFEYAPPAQLRIISDGSWVAVQDRRMNTMERYPLSTTPLNLLLSGNVDLMREARVVGVEQASDLVGVTLEDSSRQAAGQLTLYFDPVQNQLRRWIVTDAQGLDTTVDLSNPVAGQAIDPGMFRIVEERVYDTERGR